uniref:Cytochrome b561 domain-containing protein n=1 Tax=Parascaris equorum TaxID=6256 RepID=A0A914S4S8_PAREQ
MASSADSEQPTENIQPIVTENSMADSFTRFLSPFLKIFAPENDAWVTMEIFSVVSDPSSNYIAVGFSKDDLMEEGWLACCGTASLATDIAVDSRLQVKEEKNVELIEASRNNGKIYCKFRQRIVGDGERFANLNDTYSILLAHGITKDPKSTLSSILHSKGESHSLLTASRIEAYEECSHQAELAALAVHSLDTSSDDFPMVAAGKFNVAVFGSEPVEAIKTDEARDSVFSKKTRRFFVHIHGSNGNVGCVLVDKPPTFQIHRTLNVLGVVAMLFAVLFAFIGKGWRWTGPAVGRSEFKNTSPGAVHSLVSLVNLAVEIGAISVGLAVAQPLGALLRCAPDAKARPIFNWLHRLAGLFAFALAALSVLIAAIFFHVWSDRGWAILLVIIYILIVILFLVTMEVSDGNHSCQIRPERANFQAQCLTTTLVSIFVLLALVIAALLIILIGAS